MSSFLKNICVLLILTLFIVCELRKRNPTPSSQQTFNTFLSNAQDTQYSLEERIGFAIQADSIAKKQHSDTAQLRVLTVTGNLYITQDCTHLAQSYLLKAVDLAKSLTEKEELATAFNSLGAVYTSKSEYDSALGAYNKAIDIFRETGNQKYLAQTLSNKGLTLKNQGYLQEAFDVTLSAIKILETEKDTGDLGAAYTVVGNILKDLGRWDDALLYHRSALEILRKEGDSIKIALSLNNIGNIFRYKKQYTEALADYLPALKIFERRNNVKKQALVTDNIGQVYFEQRDYQNAERYFLKALDLRMVSEDKDGFLTTSNRLSKLYLETGENGKAETIALEAKSQSPQNGFLKQRLENNSILSDIYSKKDKNAALYYAKESLKLKDSLFSTDLAEKISQMKISYETEKKDIENLSLKKDKIIATAKLKEQKNEKTIWAIIAIATILISGLISYTWRKKRNHAFEQQITAVKQEALNAQMSDHFISNAMDSINSFIENNNKQKASEYLLLFNRLIRMVLDNSFKNLIPLETEMEVLQMYIELEKLRFPENALHYEILIDDNINAESTYIPPMVFQVLVENSIKHGFKKDEGGAIQIKVNREENCLKCIVEDNGVGRQNSRNNIPKIYNKKSSLGSSIAEKIISLSWHLNEKATFKIHDGVNAEMKPTGTRIEFSLPHISIE